MTQFNKGDRVFVSGGRWLGRKFEFVLENGGEALLRYSVPPSDTDERRGATEATRYESAPVWQLVAA